MASLEDCRWADVIVVVKRVPDSLLQNIRASGRPWVYDIVDAYPQPACSSWDQQESIRWAQKRLAELEPDSVLWPCRRMSMDVCGEMEGKTLYHHHRPGIQLNPIRKEIKRIGYEGAPGYIDGWRKAIDAQCARIGAEFVINPLNLSDVDVVLALRDKNHAGYPQRFWKSNVKLANAHGSGTPFIGMPEPGYQETASGCEYWATDSEELGRALDWLAPQSTRQHVSETFLRSAITVEQVADQCKCWIEALKF